MCPYVDLASLLPVFWNATGVSGRIGSVGVIVWTERDITYMEQVAHTTLTLRTDISRESDVRRAVVAGTIGSDWYGRHKQGHSQKRRRYAGHRRLVPSTDKFSIYQI